MVLGALLDAGLPFEELRSALGSLALNGCDVGVRRVVRAGLSATKFVVHEDGGTVKHPHRHLSGIFKLIDQSALSPEGRDRAKGLFQRLADAEAAIHDMPVEKVHLHEVGAVDSIITDPHDTEARVINDVHLISPGAGIAVLVVWGLAL